MDDERLFSEIQQAATLRLAFEYSVFERINRSHFFDHLEIGTMCANREKILSEIAEEFFDPEAMQPRRAYAYFPPKDRFCVRRMINLPFKDLVIRNAICIVLARYLDPMLSDWCFANRRAEGEHAKRSLTADYAKKSWPDFCSWQLRSVQESNVLLKTDISAFYDSVSHRYLLETLASELGIEVDCPVMRFIGRFCQPPVETYLAMTREVGAPVRIQQGLLTGNETEGFLANVFLKPVDDEMLTLDVLYGRYNDDIRIFAKDQREARHAIVVLQQALLSRGLNLNASKTKIYKGAEEMKTQVAEALTDCAYDGEYGGDDFAAGVVAGDRVWDGEAQQMLKSIDRPFEEFDLKFTSEVALRNHDDAANFCKSLAFAGGVRDGWLACSARECWHVDRLVEILKRFPRRSRFATWKLVETAVFNGVNDDVRRYAVSRITAILVGAGTSAYGKYRLWHHLVKPRRSQGEGVQRYVDDWPEDDKRAMLGALAGCLEVRAVELVLVSLYAMWVLGEDSKNLVRIAQNRLGPNVPVAVSEALALLRDGNVHDIPVSWILEPPWGEPVLY